MKYSYPKTTRKIKLIYYLLLLPISIFALHPMVKNYNKKISKGGSQSWSIVQHKNDWIYFANNSGLMEFDGEKWSNYPIQNHTNVRSLYYDEQADRIYAGAFNDFGYYTHNESGILHYQSLISKLGKQELNFNEIWGIHKLEDAIYFRADKAIFKYRGGKISRIPYKYKINSSAVLQNALIVASKENGVSFLNGNFFIQLPNAALLNNKKICAILPFQTNKILFVTEFNGLFVFDGEKVENLKTDIDDFMTQNQVFCASIQNNKLAIGTVRNGLVIKDLKNNSTIFSNASSGLQDNTILSIAFDRQENLWLGLNNGIDYVLNNSPVYELLGKGQFFGAGYCSLIDNNRLYLGTNQGLYLTSFPLQNSPNPTEINLIPNMQGQVWALTKIDQTIFCGTDHGTFIINGLNAEQLLGIPGTWGFRAIHNRPDCILGCCYEGLFILKKQKEKWIFTNFVKGFGETSVKFEEDLDGKIWFSHWIKGISRLTLNDKLDSVIKIESFDKSKGLPTNQYNTVANINNQIVFSTPKACYTYNRESQKVEKYNMLEKLFGTSIHPVQLKSAPNGNIWSISNSNLSVAIVQNNKSYAVDSFSFSCLKNKIIPGFEDLNFINASQLILSTEDGFSWIDLSKRMKRNPTFKLSIRNIYLTNETDSIAGGYQALKSNKKIPEYDYKHNSIRFEYIAPEFREEDAVSYSYLLENFDTKWSPYTKVNTKEYTQLNSGTYTFRVRAKRMLDSQMVETTFQFRILPPWYRNNIAWSIYLILFILGLIGLLRYIQFRSQKGALEMKAIKDLEIQEQVQKFEEDSQNKKKEIKELKTQKLQYDLRLKSKELASSTMNLIRKNEILQEINLNLNTLSAELKGHPASTSIEQKLQKLQERIKQNIEHDNDWNGFADNFDLVYENYLKRLGEQFPELSISDKKLCAYLKMDLSSKDIAPLLNMSFRSVEMSRYRLRKKMGMERDVNLSEFLQNF